MRLQLLLLLAAACGPAFAAQEGTRLPPVPGVPAAPAPVRLSDVLGRAIELSGPAAELQGVEAPKLEALAARLSREPALAPQESFSLPAEQAPGLLAAAWESVKDLAEPQIADMSPAALAPIASRLWDASGLQRPLDVTGPGGFDVGEGAGQVRALEALNEEIAAGRLGLDELKARGLLREGSPAVTRNDHGASGAPQAMPFKELLFTAAHTGIYVPTKAAPLKDYQGLMVVMPGMGSDFSSAKSVMDLALTFSKAKKDPVLDSVDGRRLRLLSFPMDATMNGMAKDAPFAFGSAEGSVAALRHVVLVLKLMYPGKPVFLAGRSQGGLIALEYAGRHEEAAGVLAVNPSHPDAGIVAESVRIHEQAPADILGNRGFTLVPKIWTGYKTFTTAYSALERASKVPVLLMMGKNDPSYPQPAYHDSYQAFASREPKRRSVAVFDVPQGKSHNLWNRHEESLYRDVVAAMAKFFSSLLP